MHTHDIFMRLLVHRERLTTLADLYIELRGSLRSISKFAAPFRKCTSYGDTYNSSKRKRSENLQVQWEAEIVLASPLRSNNDLKTKIIQMIVVRGWVTFRRQLATLENLDQSTVLLVIYWHGDFVKHFFSRYIIPSRVI